MKFCNLRITIITSQIPLNQLIDTEKLYILLKEDEVIRCICYKKWTKGEKATKKSKIKKIKEKDLKNHVSIHLYKNNINIKVSKQKLILIGCKNLDDIEFCGKFMCDKINEINKICKIYEDNFQYILHNYKKITEDSKGVRIKDPITFNDDHKIKKNWTNELDLDEDLKYALKYGSSLYTNVSYFKKFLKWTIETNIMISEKKIKPLEFKISMINRMFNINYKINLQKFDDKFSEIKNYFIQPYRAEIHHKIYVKVIYHEEFVGKKRHIKCVTFTVESSGSIVISGPYLPITEEIFDDFYRNLKYNEKYIRIE